MGFTPTNSRNASTAEDGDVLPMCGAAQNSNLEPAGHNGRGDHYTGAERKHMKRYLIEREIPGAGDLSHEELAAIAGKSNDVVESLGVPYRWITSYVAGDKIYCVHEADD